MIGNHHYSTWGLKDSGEDITNDIIDIATNATSFIVAAGYNFSFRHAGMMFFNELTHKANNGIPVILIVPPHLAGQYNPQPSNFTPTSWRDRVEVVTIHRHRKIFMNWKRATILDFRLFIQREIADINNKRRNMHLYPGLIPLTVNTWNNIKPLIRRLNPSIEKVKETLENYETVELSLYFVIEQWFIQANQEGIEIIYSMSYEILEIINNICEYAYANIYNESIKNDEIQNKEVIDNYNNLHDKFIEVIDQQILTVEKLGNMKQRRSGLYEKNVGLINV